MSNKNEVFEYLIDQLRQQVNKKDVTSFNVSVQISDLDEVKQVIHNLQQHIAGKDDEIRMLKDSLRQQMVNNPHKQQCEDLAQEVQSLKNQLRDASELVAELQETIKLMNEDFGRVTGRGGPLPKGKSYVVSEHGPEQSGCRKEDTQGQGIGVVGRVREGGVKVTGAKGECPHLWHYYDDHLVHCALCGLKRSDEDTQECEHDWQVKTYPWSDETYEYCPLCREVRQ